MTDACGRVDNSTPCVLPFEVLYSNRPGAYGRLVSIDGVVVAGIAPEPTEITMQKILLFPSFERARSCRFETAIEVQVRSGVDFALPQGGAGYPVTLVGRVRPSNSGH